VGRRGRGRSEGFIRNGSTGQGFWDLTRKVTDVWVPRGAWFFPSAPWAGGPCGFPLLFRGPGHNGPVNLVQAIGGGSGPVSLSPRTVGSLVLPIGSKMDG
jgi:hypothetical protein